MEDRGGLRTLEKRMYNNVYLLIMKRKDEMRKGQSNI